MSAPMIITMPKIFPPFVFGVMSPYPVVVTYQNLMVGVRIQQRKCGFQDTVYRKSKERNSFGNIGVVERENIHEMRKYLLPNHNGRNFFKS